MGQVLVTKDVEKVKVLNVFFMLVFTGKVCLQETQDPETSGKVWSEEDLPSLEEDQVREHKRNQTYTSLWDLTGCTNEC